MLEQFLVNGVFAFMIIFVRFGTALMIMPGIGDSFVPANVRLFFALGLSLALSPLLLQYLPFPLPAFGTMVMLIVMEFLTGLFIGTIARILMMAMDTAGMLISLASGISNAQVFNPSLAVQGSVFGAFMSVTGVTLLFATNLHHLMIEGIMGSYQIFPLGSIPDSGSMAEMVAKAVSASFLTGFQIALPFVIVSVVLYTGMGVLTRLMPQMQVFMIAIPVQIVLALVLLSLTLSSIFLFFLTRFEEGMIFFLRQSGA